MNRIALAILSILMAAPASAEPRRTDVYDAHGQKLGVMRTDGNRTDVYDRNGRKVETQGRDGERTIIYDRNSARVGSFRESR